MQFLFCLHPSPFILPPSYFPLHIGPCRLAAVPRGAKEQAQRPTAFGGKLQTAKIAHIEPIPRRPNGSYAWATQCLIECPERICLVDRPQHEHSRQIDSPGCGNGWIETDGVITHAYASGECTGIQHDEGPPLAA